MDRAHRQGFAAHVFLVVSAIVMVLGPTAAAQTGIGQKSSRHLTTPYQGRNRGPEQTDRVSRKIKLSRNGSVSVSNVSGEIIVTAGSGDEVSIEAVKRSHGDRGQLGDVRIDINEAPSRIDVRTDYVGRNSQVSVDYTLTVPSSASVELHSVSGDVKVTGVQGV